eukprot:5358325-Pyramimonas_sp.AAC.1
MFSKQRGVGHCQLNLKFKMRVAKHRARTEQRRTLTTLSPQRNQPPASSYMIPGGASGGGVGDS